jgi:hypothetical protein
MQVDEIAGDVDRGDLPGAIGRVAVAGGEAIDHQHRGVRPRAFANEIGARWEMDLIAAAGNERGAFFGAYDIASFELSEECGEDSFVRHS